MSLNRVINTCENVVYLPWFCRPIMLVVKFYLKHFHTTLLKEKYKASICDKPERMNKYYVTLS